MSKSNSSKPGRQQSSRALRWHLALLIAGTILPLLLFLAAVLLQLSSNERAASERRIQVAANILAENVEQEISNTVRTLEALAESQELDGNNYRAFYDRLKRVEKTQPSWMTVILLTPDGRQVLNTRIPFGQKNLHVNDPTSLQRLLETRRPVIGNLIKGQREEQWGFRVRVPVERGGKLLYALTAVITPQALTDVITQHARADGEWVRTVVDAEGVVVARTRNPQKHVGQLATADFRRRSQEASEAIFRSRTLDGIPVTLAISKVPLANWTVSVGVPVEVLEAPARENMLLLIAFAAGVLLISMLGSWALSSRISKPIQSAARGAEALARGEVPQVEDAGVLEVAALGNALQRSAELLLQREQERSELLARSEAARQQAESANRLKDEFLATLSHELRTPLTAILGWASLLRQQRLPDEALGPTHASADTGFVADSSTDLDAGAAIESIERNARSLSLLVNDLLDMSRITTGKLHLDMALVDLESIVCDALDSVRPAATAKTIKLHIENHGVEPVWGDAHRLQQILWNLLTNAVKFTPPGGEVTVRLSQANDCATVEVIDNGEGIAADFLPHIFDRFRQADSSSTRKIGGMGLGLAIVRQLVEMHGGSVRVESAGVKSGAAFTVQLPVAANPSLAESVAGD